MEVELLEEVVSRTRRIETRLCQLMEHFGVAPRSNDTHKATATENVETSLFTRKEPYHD